VSTLGPDDVRHLPLFRLLSEPHIIELLATFKVQKVAKGASLFREGEVPSTFLILFKGEVELTEATEPKFTVHPVAPLGELGALTGLPRNTSAVALTDVEVLEAPLETLHRLFATSGELAATFYRGLLDTVADKVRRDKRRLDEMKQNLIRTQKAMKAMRETVLAAQETEISKALFESLDQLIDNNRRTNYRVSPTAGFPAQVKLENGHLANVLEVSEGYLKVEGKTSDLTADPSYWAGVLVMPTTEILVSGTVVREDSTGVVVKLDTLVDEFKAKLDDYSVRLQLLDFVVWSRARTALPRPPPPPPPTCSWR